MSADLGGGHSAQQPAGHVCGTTDVSCNPHHLYIHQRRDITRSVNANRMLILQVALATATQWIVYGNIPSATGFVGMALVLLAGLYLVVSLSITIVILPELNIAGSRCRRVIEIRGFQVRRWGSGRYGTFDGFARASRKLFERHGSSVIPGNSSRTRIGNVSR
jgi:hypothetical protein